MPPIGLHPWDSTHGTRSPPTARYSESTDPWDSESADRESTDPWDSESTDPESTDPWDSESADRESADRALLGVGSGGSRIP